MRVNPTDTMCGYPVLKIRELLRRVQDMTYSAEILKTVLGINGQNARILLQELEEKALIEQGTDLTGEKCWFNTEKGNQLALATAAQPIKRETATQRIKDLLVRVRQVNQKSEYLYKVKEVVLFGSYLSNSEKINDVDIAIELLPKTNDPHLLIELTLNRAKKAAMNGRVFSNFSQRLMWPQNEIILFLKSGSRVLSLHDMDNNILDVAKTESIFDIDKTPSTSFIWH